jgi:hypothetical protein
LRTIARGLPLIDQRLAVLGDDRGLDRAAELEQRRGAGADPAQAGRQVRALGALADDHPVTDALAVDLETRRVRLGRGEDGRFGGGLLDEGEVGLDAPADLFELAAGAVQVDVEREQLAARTAPDPGGGHQKNRVRR